MVKKKSASSDDSSGDDSDRNDERLLPDLDSPIKSSNDQLPIEKKTNSKKRKSLNRQRRSRSPSVSDEENVPAAPKAAEKRQTYIQPVVKQPEQPPQRKRGGRYNNQPKYKCQLSEIPLSRPIVGQDTCSPGKPAMLTIEKLKLHYVVHYMLRETWTPIIPEEPEKGRIDCYQCNLCQRRFKNNIEKDEYPGRGSMICHIATDHGLLLEAMKEDDKVNMRDEIEKIAQYDPNFLANPDPAQKDPNTGKYEDLVTIKDSIMWKIKQKQKELAEQKAEEEKNGGTISTAAQDTPIVWKRPTKIPCPHCTEYDNNIDPANLRLHIFHHYKQVWMDKVDKLEKTSDNRIFCDVCPKRRGITGASVEGAILSTICHFAIQHGELRSTLEKDDRIEKEFISELYKDQDRPEEYAKEKAQFRSYNYNYYQPSAKPGTNITPVLVVNSAGEHINTVTKEKSNDSGISSSNDSSYAISKDKENTSAVSKKDNSLPTSKSNTSSASIDTNVSTSQKNGSAKKIAKEDMDWMDTTDEDEEETSPLNVRSVSNKGATHNMSTKNQVETVEQWKGKTKVTVTNQSCKKVRRKKRTDNKSDDSDDGERSYLSNNPNQNYVRKRQKLNLSISDLQEGGSASDDEWNEKDFKKENGLNRSSNKNSIAQNFTPNGTRTMPRRKASLNRNLNLNDTEITNE